jgi:hypothetical protein
LSREPGLANWAYRRALHPAAWRWTMATIWIRPAPSAPSSSIGVAALTPVSLCA